MRDVKRVVSTGFWNDKKVLEQFSAEDKYFMLYLLTNPYTTQLGIYYLPIKHAALDMGYSEDSIRVLLDRFENTYKIIKFSKETSEVAIKNYLRHSIVKGGKPVSDCLMKEKNNVKDKSLLIYIYENIKEYDLNNINKTVLEFLNNINNNDNDNDNERIVYESCNEDFLNENIPSNEHEETIEKSDDSGVLQPENDEKIVQQTTDSKIDYESYWNSIAEKYPKKSGLTIAKQIWIKQMMNIIIGNREQVAKDIVSAIDIYLEDYRSKNRDNYQYVPRLEKWMTEDMDYWLNQAQKKSVIVEESEWMY